MPCEARAHSFAKRRGLGRSRRLRRAICPSATRPKSSATAAASVENDAGSIEVGLQVRTAGPETVDRRLETNDMDVRMFWNTSRPGVGLKPRRESQRPQLPQHARHCPVLEAGSGLGFLVYPPLEPFESFFIGHYGEGRYQFVYYFQSEGADWVPIFTVRTALPVGGIGKSMQEVEIKAERRPDVAGGCAAADAQVRRPR